MSKLKQLNQHTCMYRVLKQLYKICIMLYYLIKQETFMTYLKAIVGP